MWDATLERGMVELKHKQILARVDVLNSMSTQAMLVAGAAVSSLGGESLQTLDDEVITSQWHAALSAAFVGASALTMACSLWVIVVASNLIMLSQQSVLQGSSSSEVESVDAILTRKGADVRLVYTASVFTLLVSSLLMVWINMSVLNSLITTVVFCVFTHLAVSTIQRTHNGKRPSHAHPHPVSTRSHPFVLPSVASLAEFSQRTSLTPNPAESANPLRRLVALLGREMALPSWWPSWLTPPPSVRRAIGCLCCLPRETAEGDREEDVASSLPPQRALAKGYTYARLLEEGVEEQRARATPPQQRGPGSAAASCNDAAATSAAAATTADSAPPSDSRRLSAPPSTLHTAIGDGSWSPAASGRSMSVSSSVGDRSVVGEGVARHPVILEGGLRKAPSFRQDPKLLASSVGVAGRSAALEALPVLGVAPQQSRYFVLRADGSLSYYRAKEEFELGLAARASLALRRHETRCARDAKGAMLLLLLERRADATAAPQQQPDGGGGLARLSLSNLFGGGEPKAWAMQGKDDEETRMWMDAIEEHTDDNE